MPKFISESNTQCNLYELINRLIGYEYIEIAPFDNQLKPIKLNKLKTVKLGAHDYSIKIHSINDYAFYECDSIEKLLFAIQ